MVENDTTEILINLSRVSVSLVLFLKVSNLFPLEKDAILVVCTLYISVGINTGIRILELTTSDIFVDVFETKAVFLADLAQELRRPFIGKAATYSPPGLCFIYVGFIKWSGFQLQVHGTQNIKLVYI